MSNQRNHPKRNPPKSPPPSRSGRRPVWGWLGVLVPVVLFAALIALNANQGDDGVDALGVSAPGFSLPTTDGSTVSLDDYLVQGDTLLYFSMGVGCDGCFAQIPEAVEGLAAEGIALVPVMVDPPDRVAAEAGRFGIAGPILIDQDRSVSSAYDMIGVYGHADRPSHSFALVSQEGTVEWVKHYSTMFVPTEQLLADLEARA